MASMIERTKRRVFEEGHSRKFLVILDESPECETAVFFAAKRADRTKGGLAMLFVIEPGDFQHWLGVEEIAREEGMNKAKAVFRLHRRKLKSYGLEHLHAEEIVREGKPVDEIMELIHDDQDIAILVLGASVEKDGPGPLVSALAGRLSGTFPVPITVVPGDLSTSELEELA